MTTNRPTIPHVPLDDDGLFPPDHPLDLVARGFDRDEVRDLTGVDVGYHGAGARNQLVGVDRVAYKIEHVRRRVSTDRVERALRRYADAGNKVSLLADLGLRGENVVKLAVLFEGLGLVDEFVEADRSRRLATVKASTKAKYGVENVFRLAEFQDKAARTRVDKYGAAYTLDPSSSLSVGARETSREHLADPEFNAKVVAKRQATNMDRYGVVGMMSRPESREKAARTRESNGTNRKTPIPRPYSEWSPLDFENRAEKARATNLERHGVAHPSSLDEHKDKVCEFWANASEDERIAMREKTVATNIERYGVAHVHQLDEYRARQSKRMSDPRHQERIVEAKRRAGTLSSSTPEEMVFDLLVERFGVDDVVRQYRDERYPFACDFRVVSRDLFVEVNGLWTHGCHWFDETSSKDAVLVEKWRAKGTTYYEDAVVQWTRRDVIKRSAARTAQLNYVTFWGRDVVDECALWLAIGAPDARDWDHEYSWLPDRRLEPVFSYPRFVYGTRNAQMAARACNGSSFYGRESKTWRENGFHSTGGTIQSRLYVNRFKYVGKLPTELTDVEILNGLSLSGALRRHTRFDVSGMSSVLSSHEATSVYDPCAGWGERLFAAATSGVRYVGVDVNEAVVRGHASLVEHYGLVDQSTSVADAARHDMRGHDHDVVFTCPPYGSTEIYTEAGAENLDDEAFVAWWSDVVEMSVSPSTRVFAYQINQKWKVRMNQVLVDAGWSLVEQVPVGVDKVSHFNRTKARKKVEFEEIQVFVRS